MSNDAYGPVLGADAHDGGTRFALWTSRARACEVRLFDGGGARTLAMAPEPGGIWALDVPDVGHGARYAFVLDGREVRDPYAAFLPDGVDAPAMVWRSRYAWRHAAPARPLREHAIYEIHVGAFTRAGTYAAAAGKLAELVELGVTAIELMPVAAFPGARGWGYDGVAHYAPFAPYGDPDALRALIDEAHGRGLAVFLDVVYNHFGPAGNVMHAYGDEYFSSAKTAWGDAPNFGHPAMRRYVVRNARYWLEQFRFDGLRFDAVHAIIDDSPRHVLTEIAEDVAQLVPRPVLVAEDDRNTPQIIERNKFDGVWADDFHHQVRVALTGERDGYYASYTGAAAALAETIEHGWYYRGAPFPLTERPRGADASGLSAAAFVYCIQNHDQVGNRAFGERLTASVSLEEAAAATMLLLTLPMTPLLFMGQEWGAATPFLFFTDHAPELGRLITEGRRREFAAFAAFADEATRAAIPDPQQRATFERSRLDWDERAAPDRAHLLAIHRTMLALRASDPVLRGADRHHLRAYADGEVLVIERRLGPASRRLIWNLGAAEHATERWRHGAELLLSSHQRSVWPRRMASREALLLSYS